MKIIKNYIGVKVNDENCFLIHPYFGDVYVISNKEMALVDNWANTSEIICNNDVEKEFLEELCSKKFIIEKDEDEIQFVERAMKECREYHEKLIKNMNSAVFVLTYGCNFACPYCYESAATESKIKVMSKEMVDRIFEIHNDKINNITFYGGEPFLPENMDVIKYIISKAPSARYSAITNGYYIDEYLDILCKLNIGNIMITLDGPKEVHNKTRVLKKNHLEGTYDRILQGVDSLLSNDIRVKIRMNISESNRIACESLRDDLIKMYPAQFEKKLLMFELQPLFQLSSENRENLKEKLIYSHGNREDIKYYNTMSQSVSPILSTFLKNRRKFIPRYTFCDAENNRRFYDAEGDIYSCILSLKNKPLSIGTYYPNVEYKAESIATRNIETIEECKECKFKFLCGGGCANAVYNIKGSVMKPNCGSFLNEVYNVMPRLFKKRIEMQ